MKFISVFFFFLVSLSSFFAWAADNSCQPFFWGVANSAFQVEGHPADSDTLRWTHTPKKIKDGTNADIATDFWNRYDEDFTYAQDLGSSAFRMSIAWERVEPQENVWDEEALKHYEDIILAMRRHHLEPVVTLLHSDLPVWVAEKGGTLSKTFPTAFAQFMFQVVKRFSGGPAQVKYWITMNEPSTYAQGLYIDEAKTFSEKALAPKNFLQSIANQVRGHIAGVRLVRTLPYEVKIGFAQDWQLFQASHANRHLESRAAFIAAKTYNQFFVDGVIKGNSLGLVHYNIKGVKTVDFVGLNYYTRQIINLSYWPPSVKIESGGGMHADNKMEIYPEGLETVLLTVQGLYGLPMLITENGMADQDENDVRRVRLLTETIASLDSARAHGANVFGYLHWSLTDNFEWGSGMSEHYGLMKIEDKTLNRIPRPSYGVYKKIIHDHLKKCGSAGMASNAK